MDGLLARRRVPPRLVLHMTWFIKSLAHFYGYRPYDVNI